MKSTIQVIALFVATVTSAASLAAPNVSNPSARAQMAKMFLGNTTRKTENKKVQGLTAKGDTCTINAYKSRYGTYIEVITTKDGLDGYLGTGVTNSAFTTQNLQFKRDDASGVLEMSRLGVSNINERGEDYNAETLIVQYQMVSGLAEIQSVTITLQPLDPQFHNDNSVTYLPMGAATTVTCIAQ